MSKYCKCIPVLIWESDIEDNDATVARHLLKRDL